jgi:hypothetical protein
MVLEKPVITRMQVWKYGSMEVWKCVDHRSEGGWKNASMEVWKCGSVVVVEGN